MKIIFCHHGLRHKSNPPTQDDVLEPLGESDAENVSKLLAGLELHGYKIKAIISSPFFRCARTAEIINNGRFPVYFDDRLNEMGSFKGETWVDMQNRVMDSIFDAVNKYDEDDAVVFVTSGLNVVAFMSLAYGIAPSESAPQVVVPSCSPLIFKIDKSSFEGRNKASDL